MTSTAQHTDPRPLLADAIDWVHGLVTKVDTARLDEPTPCPDFDVRALLGHLVSVLDRATAIGRGEDVHSVPVVTTGFADDGWADAYAAAAVHVRETWSDAALLDTTVTVPWGQVPGRAAVWGYLNETLVHGWDLAVATGLDAEADPALAVATLPAATRAIPAETRGGDIPFGPVVEPSADAGPTERLANWSGHHR